MISNQLNLFDTISPRAADRKNTASSSTSKWFDSSAVNGIGGWPDKFGIKMLKELNGKGPRTVSLFSGGGGLDIGFHQSGYDVLDMVEIESAYVASLKKIQK